MTSEGEDPPPAAAAAEAEEARRHRADDDVEALASGSFAPVRPPGEGGGDLPGDAAASSPGTPFSIDEGGEEDDVPSNFKRRESTDSMVSESGKGGKKITELSSRTAGIMSDYQAYLAEIETEFPPESEEGGFGGVKTADTTALTSAREGIRDAYRGAEEGTFGGGEVDAVGASTLPSLQEDEPLARTWNYGPRPGLGLDRTGGPDGDEDEGGSDGYFERKMLMRGQSYSHPWLQPLRSGRVKRGLCGLIAALVVVGLSVGISHGKKDKEPDEGKEDVTGQPQEQGKKPSTEVDPYDEAMRRYHPIFFDRSNGWEGKTYAEGLEFCDRAGYAVCPYEAVCPVGMGKPLGGYSEGSTMSWIPILDLFDDWVLTNEDENSCIQYSHMHGTATEWGTSGKGSEDITRNIMCCLESDVPPSYEAAFEEFDPRTFGRNNGWAGNTYADAVDFCEDIEGYGLCPYRALCPNGPGSAPLEAIFIIGEQYVAVLDGINDWVQVGSTGDPCTAYSHEHSEGPAWGVTGVGSDEITQNQVCCRLSKDAATGEMDSLAYNLAMSKYHPEQFDRSKGWEGRTYVEAVDFCGALEGERQLCNYAAVCPLGHDQAPVMGFASETESWIPVIDKVDEPCVRWSAMMPEPPEWGYTGEGNEEITRNVLCCDASSESLPVMSSPSPPLSPEPPQEHSLSGAPPSSQGEEEDGEAEAQQYGHAMSKYQPEWFDRSKGWVGETFQSAVNFCDVHNGGGHSLCPYEAICPAGSLKEPAMGYIDDGGEAWIPISGGRYNDWTKVNADGACLKWSELHPEGPVWGNSGGNAEMTQNVVCCAYEAANVASPAPQATIPSVNTQEDAKHQQAMSKYQLEWFDREKGWKGQTYEAAHRFCAAIEGGGKQLCNYDAVCPLGVDGEPTIGYIDTTDEAWVAIADKDNDWVILNSDQSCLRYSFIFPDVPEWGVDGVGNEAITRNVLCCAIDSSESPVPIEKLPSEGESSPSGALSPAPQPTPPAESLPSPSSSVNSQPSSQTEAVTEVYAAVEKTYNPQWFDRNKGWAGTTYHAAVDFCAALSSEGGYVLCPLVAICPLLDSEPLGGYRQEPEGTWVPISDRENAWVQASSNNACELYGNGSDDSVPSWGTAGEGAEGFTRHVACCLVQGAAPAPTTAIAAPTPSQVMNNGVPDEQASPYQQVLDTYEPRWFNRANGWMGQTYMDAFSFCSDFNGYLPCTYDALCPLGSGQAPLGGYRESGAWVPISDGPNRWVNVGIMPDKSLECTEYSHIHASPPEWGEKYVKDSEGITRNLACCLDASMDEMVESIPPPTPGTTSGATSSDDYYYMAITKTFEPQWYDRNKGWDGMTYLEALQFCAKQESRVPCTYEAYCPIGTRGPPTGGVREGISWAPMLDAVNGWVQVGADGTCQLYSEVYRGPPSWGLTGHHAEDITRHIMCCLEEPLTLDAEPPNEEEPLVLTEAEETVLNTFKAEWYGRDDGYEGGSYIESAKFCGSLPGTQLCPYVAYCPNGPYSEENSKPVFLQLPAFEDGQWAPMMASTKVDEDLYVMIGTVGGDPTTTCQPYSSITNNGDAPTWAVDGSDSFHRKYVLCCKDPSYVSNGLSNPTVDLSTGKPDIPAENLSDENFNLETEIAKELASEWLDVTDGWAGGSHADAEGFCSKRGNGKQLCPYAAYCPFGPGQPVSKGHSANISAEGVQWAPVFGHNNHWVMVGQKHKNSATTCFGHEDLEGDQPDWGLTSEKPEIKKHIMCCDLKQ
ncbi:hypothetical protein ACHAWF_013996 [Thalassiosira exigua]